MSDRDFILKIPSRACVNGITKSEAQKIKEINTIESDIDSIEDAIDIIESDIETIEEQISNIKTDKWIELPFSNYSQFGRYNTKLYDSTTNKTKYDLQIMFYHYTGGYTSVFIGKDTDITKTIAFNKITYQSSKTYITEERFRIQNILTTLDDRIGESARTSIAIDNTTFEITISTATVATPREEFKVFVFANDIENL